MKALLYVLCGWMLLAPAASHAWWNGDWAHRSKIKLNTSGSGADIQEAVPQVPLLIRLHTGNFTFPDAKEDGADLRFVASDDKTPLKYHIEQFDAVNELALIWVQMPKLAPGSSSDFFWMYYGNDKAAPAQEAKETYDVNQILVFHFAEKEGPPKDQTAYGNHASRSTAVPGATGWIGNSAGFNGAALVVIPASPTLKLSPTGLTFTAWVKATAGQSAVLFSLQEGTKSVAVRLAQDKLYAEVSGGKEPRAATSPIDFPAGSWHHIAVTLGSRLVVYLDGKEAASSALTLPEIAGEVVLGQGFNGEMDEVTLSNTARSASWIKTAAAQGPEQKLVTYGETEEGEGGGSSYFSILLGAVTLDGWLVIGILMVMMFTSFGVMVGKALFVLRMEQANKVFLTQFQKLAADLISLDRDERNDDEDDVLLTHSAMSSGDYTHSSVYRIYHVGVRELKHRLQIYREKGRDLILSPQAVSAIRASLDAGMVRENHRLNSQMVLLTIAISGGPFLGLLGTVVGVMITFAAIAAAGDVNVNSIAPGIAAALVATVAGLAVAIPSLFGYNYLATRIRNINADMQVFADEFITKLAEVYSV